MSQLTSNHDQIIAWASRHEATPAEVIPRVFDSEPAILHFLFGNARVGLPEIGPISWESFFAQFDLMELAIVLDDSPTFQIVHNEKVSIYRPAQGSAKPFLMNRQVFAPRLAGSTNAPQPL